MLSLHPTLLQDIWDDIHRVGEATQQQRQAATLLEELFARVNTVVAESIMVREPPRVAMLVWTAPLMLAGYWAPDLIQLAGGTAGLCRPGAPALVVEWAELQEYAPEVLLLCPYGAPLTQTRTGLPALQGLPGWDDLPAVRQGSVYAVDGQTYFHRPGPRIVDSLETLAGLLHPDLFGEFLPAGRRVILPCYHLMSASCSRVVAWVLSTLLCSAHAWVAITAFRVRADYRVYCGGKAWKQKTS